MLMYSFSIVNQKIFFIFNSTHTRKFFVSIQPPVGELMMPVFMTENEFKKEQGKKSGCISCHHNTPNVTVMSTWLSCHCKILCWCFPKNSKTFLFLFELNNLYLCNPGNNMKASGLIDKCKSTKNVGLKVVRNKCQQHQNTYSRTGIDTNWCLLAIHSVLLWDQRYPWIAPQSCFNA